FIWIMKKKLAIIGSGDLGQQIAYYASTDCGFKVIGFYDDFKDKEETTENYKILGKIDDVLHDYDKSLFDELIIAIGYKHLDFKESVYNLFRDKIPFATIVHSSSILDNTASVGAGSVIYPGCIVDQNVEIGENSLLNVGCCIAHDTKVDNHCFLSPRVAIAGFAHIGKRNIIGINSTVIDNIKTVDDVQFGGGSVVIKNIDNK